MDADEKLKKIVSQWESGAFISQAMLTHYSNSMSKLLNKTANEIKEEIIKEAQRLQNKHKEVLKEKQ